MKALTASEMREVDRLTTERIGISGAQLMENAGRNAADAVRRVIADHPKARVSVLCGKGNNGGDGLVVARYLREDKVTVDVILFARPAEIRGDAATNLKRWLDSGGSVSVVLDAADWQRFLPNVCAASVIVDAMLGTGLRGPATGVIAQAITDLNRFSQNATAPIPAFILAVDTPSGLQADSGTEDGPVLSAHWTVTFTAPKVGQLVSRTAVACGGLEVVGIGSPPALVEEIGKGSLRWAGPDEFASLPLVRAADSHKGTFGHVLVIGGSAGKSGAAALAGYASLRIGAGLTTIACPSFVQSEVASFRPEYMTEGLASTADGSIAESNLTTRRLSSILDGKTVVAIGPGLGTHTETQRVIRRLVRESTAPLVLDADGLNAFAGELDALRERKSPFLAITPHPGEMARLLESTNVAVQVNRLKFATEAAGRANAHVILKGFHTVLAAPDGRIWVNTSGGPALAKGGSGDVLTGVLAACTAQFGTQDWLRVLALGVFLHGTAADILARENEPSGVLASEVAATIPAALEWLLREIRGA